VNRQERCDECHQSTLDKAGQKKQKNYCACCT
jgi:hypothetical protein